MKIKLLIFQEIGMLFLAVTNKFIYHISIIDYLQNYNFEKKTENFFKTIWRGHSAEISAVPPPRYAKRFIDFMSNLVIVGDKRMYYGPSSINGSALSIIASENNDLKDDNINFDGEF